MTFYKIKNTQTGRYSCKGMYGWDIVGHIFTSEKFAKANITRYINYNARYGSAKTTDEYKGVELQYVELVEVEFKEGASRSVKEMHEKRKQDKADKALRKVKRAAEKKRKQQEKLAKKGLAPAPPPAKVTVKF